MKNRHRIPFHLTAAAALVLAANAALAENDQGGSEAPYAPLLLETRPLDSRGQTDYNGVAELGLGYTGDDNFMFGQYNGLHEDGVTVIGNLNWRDSSSSDSYWRVSVSDLGLDTREGEIVWGRSDRLRVQFGFDSQIQVRNNSGETPFRGSDSPLRLPDNWEAGSTTADFSQLEASLNQFDRELERDKLSAAVQARLSDNWRLETGLSYEEKTGHRRYRRRHVRGRVLRRCCPAAHASGLPHYRVRPGPDLQQRQAQPGRPP